MASLPTTSSGPSQPLRDACNNVAGPVVGEITIRQPHAHKGSEGAAEFQKIIDHRGIVLNSPIGALAHLQIARAYDMNDTTTAAVLELTEAYRHGIKTHWSLRIR
jgi:hypothetical protein